MTIETEAFEVLNPVSQLAADMGDAQAMSPRPSLLDGKRIGLYWNRKPGGIHFLNQVEGLLKQQFPGVQTFHYDSRRPIQKSVVDAIEADRCDVVIGATAD